MRSQHEVCLGRISWWPAKVGLVKACREACLRSRESERGWRTSKQYNPRPPAVLLLVLHPDWDTIFWHLPLSPKTGDNVLDMAKADDGEPHR